MQTKTKTEKDPTCATKQILLTKLKAAAWLKCWSRCEEKGADLEEGRKEVEKETATVSTIFPRIFSSLSPKNDKGVHY